MLVERGIQIMNFEVVGDAYAIEFDWFIAANFESPLSLLTPQLARLAAMGGFRRWDPMVRRFVTDDRLLEIIVKMFQQGEFNRLRLANKAIAEFEARLPA